MKVSNRVENIFAHAVALDQSGGMKNTVYALDREIFILNYDHTILLRFRLRDSEKPFKDPISFRANDYDSSKFYEENGKIVFETEKGGYVRKKSCGTPGMTPEDVKELFDSYSTPEGESLTISKSVLSLLDENLSHIEFSADEDGPLNMVQRNVYSGAIIEISPKEAGLSGVHKFENAFGPIGLRTADFMGLFSFQDSLIFTFALDSSADDEENMGNGFILAESLDKKKMDMQALVACCLYDEIIEIKEAKNGREKSKIRRSK